MLPNVYAYKVDITNGTAEDLGRVPAEIDQLVWDQVGKSVLFPRTLNGLTNLWSYDLNDKAFTQVSFGIGPDVSPIVDPAGKGIYFVNGKSAGVLKAWNAHSKQVVEIDAENGSQPSISPDNKKVMYVLAPAPDRSEVWVARVGKEAFEPQGTRIAQRSELVQIARHQPRPEADVDPAPSGGNRAL